ncbi:MAG: NPXTG-anchored protein [Ruminiclostridium sp.]|nr:NPXTG-anchored protein [Ruminiclostridium sp.]
MKKFLSGIAAAALAVTAVSAAVSAWDEPAVNVFEDSNLLFSKQTLVDGGVDEALLAEGAEVTVEFTVKADVEKAKDKVARLNIWEGTDNHEFIVLLKSTSPDVFDDRVIIDDETGEVTKAVKVTVKDALDVKYAVNDGLTLTSVVLKDKDGNVFATYADGKITLPAAEDPDETTSEEEGQEPEATTSESAAATTDPGNGKPDAPNTGIEGVAVVLGVAVLATGAIIISKKRK